MGGDSTLSSAMGKHRNSNDPTTYTNTIAITSKFNNNNIGMKQPLKLNEMSRNSSLSKLKLP